MNPLITHAKELLAMATKGPWKITTEEDEFPTIWLDEKKELDLTFADLNLMDFARNHLAEIIEGYEKMSEAIDILLLLAMDEDNVWDLERANEVRIGIREYARATLRKIGEME